MYGCPVRAGKTRALRLLDPVHPDVLGLQFVVQRPGTKSAPIRYIIEAGPHRDVAQPRTGFVAH